MQPDRPIDTLMASMTKNFTQMGFMFLGLAVVLLVMNANYIKNVLAGPMPIDEKGLVAAGKAKVARNYVLVNGSKIFDTGIAWGKKRRGTDELKNVNQVLVFVAVGHHLLPVKLDTDDKPTLQLEGELKPIDYDRELPGLIDQEINNPEIRQAVLPMVLDASMNYNTMFQLLVISVSVLSLLGTWNLFKSRVLWANPEKHPIGKALASYGNFEMIRNEVNEDFAKDGLSAGQSLAMVGRKWFLAPNMGKASLIKLDDLVWIYPTEITRSVNFVPVKAYGVRVHTANEKKAVDLTMKPNDANHLVTQVAQRAPWAYAGFDGNLMLRWTASPREVVQEVQQRKRNAAQT